MFTNLIHSFAGVRWARTIGLSAMTSQWSTPASLSQVWWRGVPTSSGCGPWTRPESAIHPVSLRLWSPWIPQTEPASEVRATPEPCGTLQQSQQLHFFNVVSPPPRNSWSFSSLDWDDQIHRGGPYWYDSFRLCNLSATNNDMAFYTDWVLNYNIFSVLSKICL